MDQENYPESQEPARPAGAFRRSLHNHKPLSPRPCICS